MNFKKKIIFLPFSTLLLGVASCSSSVNPNEELKTFVWSTYSTCKVIQQANKNSKYIDTGKKIDISMMKGEKESGQIIVTSNLETKINFVYGQLVNENGDILPKEKVQIYLQKYLKVDINKHGGELFDNGDHIPDFLLPMEKAVEYDENYVSRNANQGITVEIDSNGIPSGKYKGNFKLTINGVEEDIPVSVEVWDFEYVGKSKIKSCWLTYTNDLFGYEYDSTDEKAETYMAFTSEYKACPYLIQSFDKNDPVTFADQMERLFKIKNYNTIIIPYDFQLDYVYGKDYEKPAKFIEEIARRCTDENFYLDYAVFYPSTYDEADADRTRPKAEASPNFFKKGGEYQKTLQGAYNNLKTSGFFNEMSYEEELRYKNAILNIPAIFTNVGFIEDWIENWPATFCPYESLLASPKFRERYIDSSTRCGNDYWTYTCTDPDYPFPSHHLDDDNLSMRVLGWMEKSYNVGGYLYYETCLFPGANPGQYHNQYSTGLRYVDCNGDGFILYPGNGYGSEIPFPSSRLITYRDGLEDYDMLCIYEDLLNKQALKYNIPNFDPKDYVNDIYDSLFYNAVSYTDHSLLVKARKELARRILTLKNNPNVFFKNSFDNANNQQIVEAYSTMPTLFLPTGEAIKGSITEGGFIYKLPNTTNKIVLFDYDLNSYIFDTNKVEKVSKYTSSSIDSGISYSEKNILTPIDENSLDLKIVSEYKDVDEFGKPYVGRNTRHFNPFVRFKVDNFADTKYIEFEYTNNGTNTIDFTVELTKNGATSSKFSYEHSCMPQKTKKVTINLTKSEVDLSSFNTLDILFTNYHTENDVEVLIEDRYMNISNIYFKGGN